MKVKEGVRERVCVCVPDVWEKVSADTHQAVAHHARTWHTAHLRTGMHTQRCLQGVHR